MTLDSLSPKAVESRLIPPSLHGIIGTTMPTATFDLDSTLAKLANATSQGQITASAEGNIRTWLTESRYAAYAAEVAQHIQNDQWQILDDVFWTVIPFGTGGRRGRMYPIGSNAINERTIGESAQGLADYVKEHVTGPLTCAIAFDTRHNSPEFARLCAGVMVAAGFHVYFLEEIRSTPELSFLVRHKQCSCGIMVTASHNPPSDNAVKAYWSTGGQILPPHDKGVIQRVMNDVDQVIVADFDQAVEDGNISYCKDEVDVAFVNCLKTQSFPGSRDVRITYSPLHGVGSTAVLPALEAAGFRDVELYGPHSKPDGDFPNVPDNVSNPENQAVFDAIIEHCKQQGRDIILATDPDCDRLGCAAPVTPDGETWATLTGNRIGTLLCDYVLGQRQQQGSLSPEHFVVKTLVTTEMMRRVADSYGVRTQGDLLVGFKWIGGVIDEFGPDKFVFGAEESHGYLVGQYARDKDGAVAAMLLAELAAMCKEQGKTIHSRLDELFVQHGYHAERLVTQKMEGSQGMALMKSLMAKFRSAPPSELAGIRVKSVRDYLSKTVSMAGASQPLNGPTGDLIIIDLEAEGNYVAARPSGTEPKVKFYMFTRAKVESELAGAKVEMEQRLDQMQHDLEAFAASVSS